MPETDIGAGATEGAGNGARPVMEEVDALLQRANGGLVGRQPLTRAEEEGESGLWRVRRRYFWLSVFSVIFGCSCVGVYALINASRAEERERQGDVEGAWRCRRNAVKYSVLSFVGLVLSVGLGLVFIVLVSYLVRVAQ